jgi:hypothetical protein
MSYQCNLPNNVLPDQFPGINWIEFKLNIKFLSSSIHQHEHIIMSIFSLFFDMNLLSCRFF